MVVVTVWVAGVVEVVAVVVVVMVAVVFIAVVLRLPLRSKWRTGIRLTLNDASVLG